MPAVNPSLQSPRSVTEHPSILKRQSGTDIAQALDSLPNLIPRNAIQNAIPSQINASTNGSFVETSRVSNPQGPQPIYPTF